MCPKDPAWPLRVSDSVAEIGVAATPLADDLEWMVDRPFQFSTDLS
jgi:hypothetical protein